MFILTFWVLYN